jgi:hypothetical protein
MEGDVQMEHSRLDLLALMPCPLKIPLEKEILKSIRKLNDRYETSLTYQIVSNAVEQAEVFQGVMDSRNIDELPEIMIAPGFSRFFYQDFVRKYRITGCFKSVNEEGVADEFRRLGVNDPDGYYDILGFNPLVFLVDKTRYPDMPTPYQWSDLTKNEYVKKVAYRGHNDREFCEGILLNVYKELGREGIRRLGTSVKSRLHPAQMAKLAGSKSEEAPAVSVIPYSFACMARPSKNVEIVWPEDGAIVNPLVMLVKKNCRPVIMNLATELSDTKISSVFFKGGFYSLYHEEDNRMDKREAFKWLGWDFIKSHNLHELLEELNEIMMEGTHSPGDSDTGHMGEGVCTCS